MNQAASLTVGQLSSLSSEQLQVISETLDGLDDVDQPTVGDNNDDNMDSGKIFKLTFSTKLSPTHHNF